MEETKKFKNRLYRLVPNEDVEPGDIITYIDGGTRTQVVESVSRRSVTVEQPKGFSPPTKRVSRHNIKETYRWHRKE